MRKEKVQTDRERDKRERGRRFCGEETVGVIRGEMAPERRE